jgi:hypothetical protein
MITSHASLEAGHELRRTEGLQNLLLSGLLSMVSNNKIVGSVRKVSVVEARPNELVLKMEVQGFSLSTVTISAVDLNGKRINGFTTSKFKIPASSNPANPTTFNASLKLLPLVDTGLVSPLLLVTVSRKNAANVPVRMVSFALDKTWSNELDQVDVRIAVKPIAIGKTKEFVNNLKSGLNTITMAVMQPRPVIKIEAESSRRKVFNKKITLSDASLKQLSTVAKPAVSLNSAAKFTAHPQLAHGQLSAVKPPPKSVAIGSAVKVNSKNLGVIKSLPKNVYQGSYIANFSNFKIIQKPPTPASIEPSYEVSSSAIQWHSVITEPGINVDLRQVLGIYNIYADANENSGVHYFVPNNYGITYDRDYKSAEGLGLRISYDRSLDGSSVADNSIRVAMQLDSQLDASGIGLATRIMQKLARSDNRMKFTRLEALPTGGPVQFDFSSGLMNIVASEDVNVLSYSDALEAISVAWSSDELDAEIMRTSLVDPSLGIPGEVVFPLPSASGTVGEVVPARIDITDPRAYKALQWQADGVIVNHSPLPVRVKRLHALDVDYGVGPRVYSWDLGDITVPALATMRLDLSDFPTKINELSEKIWFEYKLDPSCGDCLEGIVDKLVIANVTQEISPLTLRVIDPFSCHAAFAIKVDTRSHFYDPSSRELVSGPALYLEAQEDHSNLYPIGSAFVGDRMSDDGETEWPFFEYRLSAILPTGEEVVGDEWISHTTGTSLFLGEFQIKSAFADRACVASETE